MLVLSLPTLFMHLLLEEIVRAQQHQLLEGAELAHLDGQLAKAVIIELEHA